jgi:cytochrome c-type biogenesis protein CcmH
MRSIALAAAAVLLLAAPALAQYAPQSAGSAPLSPELEARVHALGKQLRCATCQGLSIADSPASMARSQLDMVRALVQEGQTDEQIKQFFVERFGEWALLRPRADPTTALLWAGPVLLILGGLAFVFWFAVRHRATADPAAGEAAKDGDPAAPDAAEDPYLSAVRAELER